MRRQVVLKDSAKARSAVASTITEYPSIERLVKRVDLAPHGCKRALQKSLVKARLRTMQREIRAASGLRPPGRTAAARSAT